MNITPTQEKITILGPMRKLIKVIVPPIKMKIKPGIFIEKNEF